MKIDEDLKIQLDEAFERGTTKAELDLIREEYEKKKRLAPRFWGIRFKIKGHTFACGIATPDRRGRD
jgi:hypothetical protein